MIDFISSTFPATNAGVAAALDVAHQGDNDLDAGVCGSRRPLAAAGRWPDLRSGRRRWSD